MTSPQPPWVTDTVYDFLGTTCRIRSTDAAFGELVHGLFMDFPRSADETKTAFSVASHEGLFEVVNDAGDLVANGDRDVALVHLLGAVNAVTIDGLDSPALLAGGVAHNGDVIAFLGQADAGKSTLVAACVLHGLTYVTDEALVIDSVFAEVIPYPKAIWLSDVSRRLLGIDDSDLGVVVRDRFKSPVLAVELGGQVAARPLGVAEVVMLDLSGGPALLEQTDPSSLNGTIRDLSISPYRRNDHRLRLGEDFGRDARTWRLSYGDPMEAAALIADTVVPH